MLIFVDKPVHFNKLQEVYSQYQKKVNEYSRKSRDKKKHKISENKDEQEEIVNAINFLKSKGFKIFSTEL